jgi:phosphatidylinositol kinase/protein kinase (PI-3  family)
MRGTPTLRDYIRKLQAWRDSYERSLDARPKVQQLDQYGCNLIDFHHAKFDDVEVPGQYVHVSSAGCWADGSISMPGPSWSRLRGSTRNTSRREGTATVSGASP